MNETPILQVKMLGNCVLHYGDKIISDTNNRIKKPWTLLEYLIVYRNREIPIEELIDLLYLNDQGANPQGALKTLVYRVRAMLEELGMPENRDVILAMRGSYAWNINIPMIIDVDQFELACQRTATPWLSPEDKLEICLGAIALYKGDFLSRSSGEGWVNAQATYYHNMYVRLVQTTIGLLLSQDRWDDIIHICRQAIAIDGYEEYFYFYLIRALVKSGRTRQAMDTYKKMYTIFYTELGVTPSAELAALYREISREGSRLARRQDTGDLAAVSQFLLQEDRLSGAFFCELEVFKDIYNLEARSISRSKRSICLALLSIVTPDKSPAALKMLNNYMDKLGDCIQNTLRRGDVVSKYSISQYVLLLPTSSAESGDLALQRVIHHFTEKYPRCPLLLESSIQFVTPPV